MKKTVFKYETVEVDVAPEKDKEKWVKWGTFKQLREYVENLLFKMAVLKLAEHMGLKYKEIGNPQQILKELASGLIFGKPNLVLEFLRASNPKIQGWRCIPTKEEK